MTFWEEWGGFIIATAAGIAVAWAIWWTLAHSQVPA